MEVFFESGIALLHSIQTLGQALVPLMKAFSFLGTEEFFLLVLPALYWCIDSGLGLRVALILLIGNSLNGALKLAFHAPRPYWVSRQVVAFSAETSFGMPSGHAQIASGVWGMIAATVRRLWVWVVCLSLIFLIGFSRLYLGVHFPHDVFFGWLFGAITLAVILLLWQPIANLIREQSLGNRFLMGLGLSFVLILIELVPYLWLRVHFTLPQSWIEGAISAGAGNRLPDPLTIEGAWSNAGAFFGLVCGFVWMDWRGGFEVRGPWLQRVARYVVGVLGILVFWRGLSFLFGLLSFNELLTFLLRYLRYALTGFWISAGAPLLFLQLKWLKAVGGGKLRGEDTTPSAAT